MVLSHHLCVSRDLRSLSLPGRGFTKEHYVGLKKKLGLRKKTSFCEVPAFILFHTLENLLFHSKGIFFTKINPQDFS